MNKKSVKKQVIIGVLMGLLGAVSGCGSVREKAPEQITTPANAETEVYELASELDTTLQTGINQFAYRLAEEIGASAEGENFLFSPYSISSALTLLDNAAQGETRAQMEEVLGITDLDIWNAQLGAYGKLEQPEQAMLTSANSIWLLKDFELNEQAELSYLPRVSFFYDAQLFYTDFQGDLQGTKTQIEDWVRENTGGMISDYKAVSTEETVLELINAVYFYGEWSNPFVANATLQEVFYGTQGEMLVDMMVKDNAYYAYLADKGLRGLSIPYGDGSKVMNLILPEEDADGEVPNNRALEAFEALTTQEKNEFLNALMNAPEERILTFQLPKFEMSYQVTDMVNKLAALGMVDAFDSQIADFSELGNLYVSAIAHMAKIEVDELGSRAAAVTEVTMDKTTVMVENAELSFVVNQPFLFFIQDKETGVILFMGSVNQLEK